MPQRNPVQYPDPDQMGRTIIANNPDTLFCARTLRRRGCFAEWVDNNTFNLDPNATVPMIVHLYKSVRRDAAQSFS